MRRPVMALVLAVSIVALASPGATAAAQPALPYHGGFYASGSMPDALLPCKDPVALSYEQWWEFTDFALKDGTIREVGAWSERDTFTANGRTLVSDLYKTHYTTVASDVNWTEVYSQVWHGTIFSATLPDGTRLLSAGRVDVTDKPMPWWTVDTGHNADWSAFCRYFFD